MRQPLRKPPSSLDQSELKHGSVILNNYILIRLLFRNVSPLFKRRASRDHTGALIRHEPGSQIKSEPKVSMWKGHQAHREALTRRQFSSRNPSL